MFGSSTEIAGLRHTHAQPKSDPEHPNASADQERTHHHIGRGLPR